MVSSYHCLLLSFCIFTLQGLLSESTFRLRSSVSGAVFAFSALILCKLAASAAAAAAAPSSATAAAAAAAAGQS